MGKIELFNHLTMCKQMINNKLNFKYYITILETIKQYANKTITVNNTFNTF